MLMQNWSYIQNCFDIQIKKIKLNLKIRLTCGPKLKLNPIYVSKASAIVPLLELSLTTSPPPKKHIKYA